MDDGAQALLEKVRIIIFSPFLIPSYRCRSTDSLLRSLKRSWILTPPSVQTFMRSKLTASFRPSTGRLLPRVTSLRPSHPEFPHIPRHPRLTAFRLAHRITPCPPMIQCRILRSPHQIFGNCAVSLLAWPLILRKSRRSRGCLAGWRRLLSRSDCGALPLLLCYQVVDDARLIYRDTVQPHIE